MRKREWTSGVRRQEGRCTLHERRVNCGRSEGGDVHCGRSEGGDQPEQGQASVAFSQSDD